MLSRVAENLFWMARYMERSTLQLKLLRTAYLASQDMVPFVEWSDLCKRYSVTGLSDIAQNNAGEVLSCILFDADNDSSIVTNIFKARENARSAQDHITVDVWQNLNDFYHLIRDPKLKQEVLQGDPLSVFDKLIYACMSYCGVVDLSMFRGDGFNFITLGQSVERGLHVITFTRRFLQRRSLSAIGVELVTWRYFMLSLSGYEYYLKRNPGFFSTRRMLHQAISERNFPISIAFTIRILRSIGEEIEVAPEKRKGKGILYAIGKAESLLAYEGPEEEEESYYLFLDKIEEQYLKIAQVINEQYFAINY